MHYSDYVDLYSYDQAISCHPYIDACNSSIIFRLLESFDSDQTPKKVLDAGSGSGQITRLLKGIPFLEIDACDIDPVAKKFFEDNPETSDIPYYEWDIVKDKFDKFYDAIIIRGVYHHIPKIDRPQLLVNLCNQGKIVINADEGILEYKNENERIEHCIEWYGYVIDEARRRRLPGLAEAEIGYLEHEKLNTADDGGDFKESPSGFVQDAKNAGLTVSILDRLGKWNEHRGGFYTAVIRK